ncbi:hypothetical protein [Pseudoduganella buxea]|uniref:FAD/NAD(P)-binding domain-containing protein n=1 Tax=Pseudoduganella buxea TaxID=1949069 RepID=A0A6I3T2V2_9BURK|nr:hypothetical protein [Pseudoduganella buxea]MTV55734.1 hypothetical protein [Pseudoduganella buxea]GGC13432.1 hypothetical protein GCM10011572_38550 [Pseudoduganella buxea]
MGGTVVIGTGISATAYLASLSHRLEVSKILGQQDLWHRLSPDHAMGQPAHLLTGNVVPPPQNSNLPGENAAFMLAGAFARFLDGQLTNYGGVRIADSVVDRITRQAKNGYIVKYIVHGQRGEVTCDRVVIATGPGPSRPLMVEDSGKLGVDVSNASKLIVKGVDFLEEGWQYPDGGHCQGKHVAVYGGSATAAWVVEMAYLRQMVVASWFTRPGDGADKWNGEKRFAQAFPPGGRNIEVGKRSSGVRRVRQLVGVTEQSGRLVLEFQDEGGRCTEAVDLLVYALGAGHTEHAGVSAMLDESIKKALVPYYDRNFAISTAPAILAVGTSDGSLMIVGSAMSSTAGFNFGDQVVPGYKEDLMVKLANYSSISKSLPPAAAPPEGIALVMASIEALNHTLPATGTEFASYRGKDGPGMHATKAAWTINFNTSNRTQIAAYLTAACGLPPATVNLAAALIVRVRSQANYVRGLTDKQVQALIRLAVASAAATGDDLRDRQYSQDDFINRWIDRLFSHAGTISLLEKDAIHVPPALARM